MGTYGLEGVLSAWKIGKLTTEQAVGQILQLLLEFDARLAELERQVNPPRPPTTFPTKRKPKDQE